jgi:hypothetical protein
LSITTAGVSIIMASIHKVFPLADFTLQRRTGTPGHCA